MSSTEGQQLKYSYRFTLAARTGDSAMDEPMKAEIQAYIKELLGVGKNPDPDENKKMRLTP